MFLYNLKKHEKDGSFTSMMFLLYIDIYIATEHISKKGSSTPHKPQIKKSENWKKPQNVTKHNIGIDPFNICKNLKTKTYCSNGIHRP